LRLYFGAQSNQRRRTLENARQKPDRVRQNQFELARADNSSEEADDMKPHITAQVANSRTSVTSLMILILTKTTIGSRAPTASGATGTILKSPT
jgi:hypothetical protein